MAESVIYLIEKGYKVDATLAMGDIDWSNPQNVDILIRELSKLIEYYDKHPDTEAIRMLDIPFEALLLEKKETTRYCGAGLRIHCYTGNDDYWTPCQGFSKIRFERKSLLSMQEKILRGTLSQNRYVRSVH